MNAFVIGDLGFLGRAPGEKSPQREETGSTVVRCGHDDLFVDRGGEETLIEQLAP